MKLNAAKYFFGIGVGHFIGLMVIKREIEASLS